MILNNGHICHVFKYNFRKCCIEIMLSKFKIAIFYFSWNLSGPIFAIIKRPIKILNLQHLKCFIIYIFTGLFLHYFSSIQTIPTKQKKFSRNTFGLSVCEVTYECLVEILYNNIFTVNCIWCLKPNLFWQGYLQLLFGEKYTHSQVSISQKKKKKKHRKKFS